MPAEGGEPKQLTFEPDVAPMPERMGFNNQVINWLPDSQHILFLSRRDTFNDWFGRLFTVSIDGGLPERLPVDKGGMTSFSPDGTKIAYNRIFRNFRTWKRYTGGMAQDIAIYDLKNNTYERITDYRAPTRIPCGTGTPSTSAPIAAPSIASIIYSYSLKTKQIRAAHPLQGFRRRLAQPRTRLDRVRERRLSLHAGPKIEKAQEAHGLSAGRPRRGTHALGQRGAGFVTDFDISPDGNRAVLTARGDVFTVPAKERQHSQPHANAGHSREVRRLVAGRQAGSLIFPTAAARMRSTSRRRTAWARRRASPPTAR